MRTELDVVAAALYDDSMNSNTQIDPRRDVNNKSAMYEGLEAEYAEAKRQLGEIIVRITALHQFTTNDNAGWVYALKDAATNAEEELLDGIKANMNRLLHEMNGDI